MPRTAIAWRHRCTICARTPSTPEIPGGRHGDDGPEHRDPHTGKAVENLTEETSSAEVPQLVELALSAAPVWDAMGRAGRAALLGAVPDELEARHAQIIELGLRETRLPAGRLEGELTRTVTRPGCSPRSWTRGLPGSND
ncbi:aldehyde dehydrogenase family protein [Streptomyces inhibens]|uniref:aldehyde dehydrogenase family protein n=1 Tax=Streptomyces inhibens TaxID=2293571 RepID=UPI00402AEA6C